MQEELTSPNGQNPGLHAYSFPSHGKIILVAGILLLYDISHCLWLYGVFLFQVRPVAEDEMFKVLRTGKRKSKCSITILFWDLLYWYYSSMLLYVVESSYLSCSLNKYILVIWFPSGHKLLF